MSGPMLFIIFPDCPPVQNIFLILQIMLILSSKCIISPSSSLQPTAAILALTTVNQITAKTPVSGSVIPWVHL